MNNPHKEKYFPLYWQIVEAAASQSVATRAQVGACIVTPTGMIGIGWNGMPAGWSTNDCENPAGFGSVSVTSKPEVIHAERNAIDKLTRQGIPIEGSLLFVNLAPCLECAKSIHGLGFKHIYYSREYGHEGIAFLKTLKVPTTYINA